VKKASRNLLRLLVSATALACLLLQVDLRETAAALRSADILLLVAAAACYGIGLAIRACRWWILVRSLDPEVGYLRLLKLYFIGQFFSSFLPSSFGGDVVRALEFGQDTESTAAAGTVFLDRMIGLMVLFVGGLAALPFQAARMGVGLTTLLLIVMAAGLGTGALVLESRLLRRLGARLPGALSLAGEGWLARVYSAVTGCGWRAVSTAAALSAVFVGLNILLFWLCGRALGIGLEPPYYAAVVPLVGVSGLVPSVGGWGVREMVTTAVLTPAGVPAGVAAALGVVMGVIPVVVALPGGLSYALEASRGLLARQRSGVSGPGAAGEDESGRPNSCGGDGLR
jgi:uncharacterized membrane protein YbhN (UPF0104 family)